MTIDSDGQGCSKEYSDYKKSANFLVLVQGEEQLAFQRFPESEHILD